LPSDEVTSIHELTPAATPETYVTPDSVTLVPLEAFTVRIVAASKANSGGIPGSASK